MTGPFDLAQRLRDGLRSVYGINRRNVELVYAHNQRKHYPFADDKVLCKEVLSRRGVPVAPTIAVCRGLFEVPSTIALLRDRSEFVVKPANGSGGDGILVLDDRKDSGWNTPKGGWVSEDDVYQHFANIVFGAFSKELEDTVLVEEKIVPHALFREFWGKGVCDLRIIYLEGRPVISMLRIPTTRSGGRANLHQGGIGVAVDLQTGRTTRAMSQGQTLTVHPETGIALLDRQIPAWDECVDVGRRACEAVPLGYLGVDIVIDDARGPLILEINARPGLEIQNVNHLTMGEALGRLR